MSVIYTGKGDDGTTGLLGEGRVPKHHPIPEALGAVDETVAALGLVRASSCQGETGDWILSIQRDLYHLMAELAATPDNASRFRRIDADRVFWIETQIGELSQRVQMPADFILPGDSPAGAALAFARTVTRRAERRVAHLHHEGGLENIQLLRYLNRLSSFCFILEIYENSAFGKTRPTLAKRDHD